MKRKCYGCLPPRPAGRRAGFGFTLVEVLVALAVLALGLGAVLQAAAGGAATMTELRERTLAAWVAGNRLNAARLAPRWPELGSSQGQAEMAGGRWLWRLEVSATADRDLRRLRVRVWPAARPEGSPLADQLAFQGPS